MQRVTDAYHDAMAAYRLSHGSAYHAMIVTSQPTPTAATAAANSPSPDADAEELWRLADAYAAAIEHSRSGTPGAQARLQDATERYCERGAR